MPNITEQQLRFVGQALDLVVKGLDPNDSRETKDLIAEGNDVIYLLTSIWKKGKQAEHQIQNNQSKEGYQPGVGERAQMAAKVGGSAFQTHKGSCAVCSSGEIKEIKNLLSRFIRY